MGRMGGQKGFSACPGILYSITNKPIFKYLGILGVLIPLTIYMFLSYVQAWCLGYAANFGLGNINFASVEESSNFWVNFIGAAQDGSAVGFGVQEVGVYLLIATLLNFTLIYRGINKGIEIFTRYAVPTLIIIAFAVLIRVLTLGSPIPGQPEQNVSNGLGFMWNPTKTYFSEFNPQTKRWTRTEVIGKENIKAHALTARSNPQQFRIENVTVFEQLKSPKLWLTAASQIFFSLSVGLGLIITYASYMKKDDDVVLSSLCSASANEFTEVGLGGLISLPAAYVFLGAAGVVGQTTFGLGFKALPMVFSQMQMGGLFGFLFFFLLFIAATNGCISCLQPSIALLEETLHIGRKRSVSIIGMVTLLGVGFVVYFSKDAMALEALNFWSGTFLVFIIATIQIIVFAWVLGVDKGFEETHRGAALKIPTIFRFITKYICPLFLLTIFAMWVILNVFGLGSSEIDPNILALTGTADAPPSIVAWGSIGIILTIFIFMCLLVARAPGYKTIKQIKK